MLLSSSDGESGVPLACGRDQEQLQMTGKLTSVYLHTNSLFLRFERHHLRTFVRFHTAPSDDIKGFIHFFLHMWQ